MFSKTSLCPVCHSTILQSGILFNLPTGIVSSFPSSINFCTVLMSTRNSLEVSAFVNVPSIDGSNLKKDFILASKVCVDIRLLRDSDLCRPESKYPVKSLAISARLSNLLVFQDSPLYKKAQI